MNVDITSAFSSLLLSKPAITEVVGDRVFPDRIPQGRSFPCLMFWVVTETANNALDGATGLDQARIQIDACSTGDRLEANAAAWHVWKELNGYSGDISDVHILGLARASGVRHTTSRVLAGSDEYYFVATQDLLITYSSDALVT